MFSHLIACNNNNNISIQIYACSCSVGHAHSTAYKRGCFSAEKGSFLKPLEHIFDNDDYLVMELVGIDLKAKSFHVGWE